MQINLSFDYELFFGSESGTAENCLLKPTAQLMSLAKKHQIQMIFFVDAGYLVQLKAAANHIQCADDFQKVSEQLKQLVNDGHEVALHVHPHWEDSKFENGKWMIDSSRYKLADFSEKEASDIISKYHQVLIDITGKRCTSYRAGGWCIQPFSHFKRALQSNGIFTDSSVYYKGYHASGAHAYDFSLASDKPEWQFENDCCIEEKNGSFKEVSITSDKINPFFYWKLYLKMRAKPSIYKPMGDGSWLKDKKRIYKQFYSSTNHFACADGYFASRLMAILNGHQHLNKTRMMVLSHPKSLAACSFGYLDMFMAYAKSKNYQFKTLRNE